MPDTQPAETRDTDFADFQSPHEASVDRLVEAMDRAYHRPWLMMWRSFLQGMMTGVGAGLGTVLFFAFSVYLFNVLGGVQLLRPILNNFEEGLAAQVVRSVAVPTPSPSPNQ